MIPPCTKSPDGRHNFPTGGDCLNGCGMNQQILSGGTKSGDKVINAFSTSMSRVLAPRKVPRGIHSELHEFIDVTRKEWKDQMSFGYWLGIMGTVPLTILYQMRGSVRESNARNPAKLFCWKVIQWKNERKEIERKEKAKAPASNQVPSAETIKE